MFLIHRSKKAFSIIEIAMVIVIIGILIAGIASLNGFVSKFRITTAQSLTRSSPISTIRDNSLWLETSMENSFNDIESKDQSALTNWYEQRNAANKIALQAVNGGPTYSNSINKIHAVKFTSSGGYFTFDAKFLNNTDYTITILENRESNSSDNYFLIHNSISSPSVTTANQDLLLGYNTDGQIIHSQGGSSSYNSNVSNYGNSSGFPKIITFTHSSTKGKKIYINGMLAAKDEANKSDLTGITTLALGKGYTGQIGEVIIFTRAIEASEISAIEDYLAQKWYIKIDRNTSDCTAGVATTSGCDTSSGGSGGGGSVTCPVLVTGVTSTTPVNSGAGSLNCDATNFDGGTISYDCSGGVLTPASSCQCAVGYILSGSTCVLKPTCSGGTETTIGGEKIHKFTSSGTLTCTNAITGAKVLVVGGGGGGGWRGAGGGAGGYVYNSALDLASGSYTIDVGAGGAGAIGSTYQATAQGSDGQGSSIKLGATSIITTVGGGGGGAGSAGTDALASGRNGGSGGGGSYWGSYKAAGAGTSGQGFAGGGGSTQTCSGGGGGASSVGSAASAVGGNGGEGASNSISGVTPTPYYAGGGGGGCHTSTGGLGGSGIGGNGGSRNAPSDIPATAAVANTGSGGGGGNSGNYGGSQNGTAGSDGIIIIRY